MVHFVLEWSNIGTMNKARAWHAESTLLDGRVLITAGSNGIEDLNSTELYDPTTKIWTTTGNMNSARIRHTATVLTDGTVLVVGGVLNRLL